MSATERRTTAESGRSPATVTDVVGEVRLRHLHSVTNEAYPVPVVLVPSLLSRWYIFDVHPARSLAGYLATRGLDVWIVDWGEPPRQRPSADFSTYTDEYLRRVIDDVTEATGVDHVSLLGYSLGGVLATMFTALNPVRVRNLMTLATPVDFSRAGMATTAARYFPVDPFVDFWGNIPAWWFRAALSSLALPRLGSLWKSFAGDMATTEGREVAAALRSWVGDGVPVAGEMYRTLLKDCYRHNRLIRGGLVIGGTPVKLTDIGCSLLTIAAADDHLCPPPAAEALNQAVASGDETTVTVPGGHLGAVVGPGAAHLLWTKIISWLEPRSGHRPTELYGGAAL